MTTNIMVFNFYTLIGCFFHTDNMVKISNWWSRVVWDRFLVSHLGVSTVGNVKSVERQVSSRTKPVFTFSDPRTPFQIGHIDDVVDRRGDVDLDLIRGQYLRTQV